MAITNTFSSTIKYQCLCGRLTDLWIVQDRVRGKWSKLSTWLRYSLLGGLMVHRELLLPCSSATVTSSWRYTSRNCKALWETLQPGRSIMCSDINLSKCNCICEDKALKQNAQTKAHVSYCYPKYCKLNFSMRDNKKRWIMSYVEGLTEWEMKVHVNTNNLSVVKCDQGDKGYVFENLSQGRTLDRRLLSYQFLIAYHSKLFAY